MSDIVNFEDLSPEEQKAIIARGRAQFAPLKTPSVMETAGGADAVPKPSASVAESMVRAGKKALRQVHDAVASAIRNVDTLGGTMPGSPANSFVSPQSVNPVPATMTEAGTQIGMNAAGLGRFRPLGQAALRVGAAAAGGELGGQMEGRPTGQGALLGGGSAALGEAIGAGLGYGQRIMPGAKAAINEGRGRAVQDVADIISPGARASIEAQRKGLQPLRGGTTPAALQEWALGGAGQEHASARMGQAVTAIENALGNPKIKGEALDRAYDMMPQLAKDELIGAVDKGGFTIRQAQAVRSWLGSGAFGQSPGGQGVGQIPQQQLWQKTTKEIESSLGPEISKWQAANKEYGGISVLLEALRGQRAFQGMPNRIFLNTPSLADTLSANREDFSRRMGGRPQLDALANAILSGGQLGTRDSLAPGAGGAMDALRQVYGQGRGGAPQILGSAIRTVAPNIGSEYTGQQAPLFSPETQSLLDLLLMRQGLRQFGQ